MIDRVGEWWSTLNPRERIFLAGGGAIILLVLMVQIALLPSLRFRADAERALERQAVIHADIAMSLSRRGKSFAASGQSLTALVTSSASAHALEISRLLPGEGRSVTLWLDNAPPEQLYLWLTDLQQNHGVIIRRVSMSLAEPGVNASLHIAASG